MTEEIISNLDNPAQLEKIYRANKSTFKRAFGKLYPELKGSTLADCWYERLNYESDELNWGTGKDMLFMLVAAVAAGLVAKLPVLLGADEAIFYSRNIGFICLPFLMAYFAWKNNLPSKQVVFISLLVAGSLLYVNLLPASDQGDTLLLVYIHLPLMLWGLLGATFTGNHLADFSKRLDFLKYNGDLVVMIALIGIAGGIMSGITISLFSLIGYNIEKAYGEYVIVFGLAAAPIVGTYLIRSNPQLVGKVSPVIAKIFSPLVLVMLTIYLVAVIYSGKNPYNDREFLFIFNALIIGVMAIIFFSIAESSRTIKSKPETWVLFLLSVVTIIVNSIAVSAITYRLATWGITPNRVAVLGSNVLMLVHLLLVANRLFRVITKKGTVTEVGNTIASYLPVYFAWTIVVTFLFPLLFGLS